MGTIDTENEESIGIPIPNPLSFPSEGSAERNKAAQEEALRKYLGNAEKVLEIASGFGEAISYLASCYPDVVFLPTDPQKPCLERLHELAQTHQNMIQPRKLNIFSETQWENIHKEDAFDGILVFNLIHLIPWQGTYLLLEHASRLLKDETGFLAIHGPFLREGMFMSEVDRLFDEDIKSRDPEWGLRDLEEVMRIAGEYQFRKEEIREMPAGNWMLILRRQ